MDILLKAFLCLNIVICCWAVTTTKPTTTSTTTTIKSKPPTVNVSQEDSPGGNSSLRFGSDSNDFGIAHIIKHSKLFTEFVSFAVNPDRALDTVNSIKGQLSHTSAENSSESHGPVQSSDTIKELFLEMMKRNSPGFIVSFDYLNITAKSSEGSYMFRKPVRMWGLLPQEMNKTTLYFLADYYTAVSYEAETKSSAKEQIDDFELWKNETLSSGEFTDDKLGDGTIGSLLGRK